MCVCWLQEVYFTLHNIFSVVLAVSGIACSLVSVPLCNSSAILKEWYKRCLVCFMWHSAFYLVQINLWYLWVKTLSWVSLQLSINGQWHIFFSTLSPVFLLLSHYHHMSTSDFQVFYKWYSLIFTPLPVKYNCNEKTCYILRGRWGKRKTQTVVSLFSKDHGRGLLQDAWLQIELFEILCLSI